MLAERNQTIATVRKFLLIGIIYLIMVLSLRLGQHSPLFDIGLRELLNRQSVTASDVMKLFNNEQEWLGHWWLKDASKTIDSHTFDDQPASNPLSQDKLFRMIITPIQLLSEKSFFLMQYYNGQYIDDGVLSYFFLVSQMTLQHTPSTSITLLSTSIESARLTQKVVLSLDEMTPPTNSVLAVELRTDSLRVCLQVDEKVMMSVFYQKSNRVQMILFALLMMVVSYIPFQAIQSMLQAIRDNESQARKYSLFTLTVILMWDTTLCAITFFYTFHDQQSLVLFFLPAFLFCLLFFDIELRLLLTVFRAHYPQDNLRQTLFKFNVLQYGSMFMIYPILLFTNLNWSLFLPLSAIIFPQIYSNGVSNHKPDLTSPYYNKFLLVRYLTLLYLKGYKYNVFRLRPDYSLITICTLLLSLQYGLLKVQSLFGGKKIIPAFMREKVYEYGYKMDLEEGGTEGECSICLSPLTQEPPNKENIPQLENMSESVMKTPCNHLYHSFCLIKWTKIKLNCPHCRARLPPFE